jgi:hypothetical protein
MTLIEPRPTTTTPTAAYRLAVVDLYRDIHKGIRSELFSLVEAAGRTAPDDDLGRAALLAHVRDVAGVLTSHADHEDTVINPALEAHRPDLTERLTADHEHLEATFARVEDLAATVADAHRPGGRADGRRVLQLLHLDLAAFTSGYLAHQDLEERVVMPALEDAVGPEAVLGLHVAIVSSIPPPEMMRSLAFMLPAMNLEDRADLLGGMRATAPPQAFEGVWALAGSVLEPAAHGALARRLDLVEGGAGPAE